MKYKKLLITLAILTFLVLYFIIFYALIISYYKGKTSDVINSFIRNNYLVNNNCYISPKYNEINFIDNKFDINAISLVSCLNNNLETKKSYYLIHNFKIDFKTLKIIDYKKNKNYSTSYFKKKNSLTDLEKDLRNLEKQNIKKAKKEF